MQAIQGSNIKKNTKTFKGKEIILRQKSIDQGQRMVSQKSCFDGNQVDDRIACVIGEGFLCIHFLPSGIDQQ